MVSSSATVPIMVAVIGVIGTILPIYVGGIITRDSNYPDVQIRVKPIDIRSFRFNQFAIDVTNVGNAPATNLSVTLNAFPMNILNVTNKFSTADIILPNFNNTILQTGANKTINHTILEIQIPKLIHGGGSIIQLEAFINSSVPLTPSQFDVVSPRIYAVYDQGSKIGEPIRLGPLSFQELFNEFTQIYLGYLVVFYVALLGLLYLYIRRRKSLKRFLAKVVKNVMEIRGVLRSDPTNKGIFSELWFEMPEKKRQDNHNIGDYLLIDDFYSELTRRNSYVSRQAAIDEKKLSELNGICLAAADKVLKDIDWNKYR